MKNLQKKFSLNVGISDHSNIFESTFAAVACGATVVEKHFTLDKNDMGPDHKASFDIKQFSKMIKNIKLINSIFKSGDKIVKKSELETRKISRKSIVAKKNILKGELFTEKNLTTKRPGTGITPMKWEKIIGKRSKKYFKKDDQIN